MRDNFQFSIWSRFLTKSNFQFINRKFILLATIVILASVLRFYKLGTNPPGLYWDEAVFGYDAYSILKTAHDHNGNFLPLFFESFGDWKMPVYHYLLIPSIAIFGLSEFAVRFPSAFLGTLTVVMMYFLTKKLLEGSQNGWQEWKGSRQRVASNFLLTTGTDLTNKRPTKVRASTGGRETPDRTRSEMIALLAALLLAISPWHIQFSRGGFESTAGLFFIVGGVYLFLKGVNERKILLLTLAFLLLTFSMYSYHAYRLFVPLFLLAAFIIYRREIVKFIPKILISSVIPILLLVPLARFSMTPEGQSRAISQSVFKKEEVEQARLDFDQKSKKPFRFMSKYLYQQPIYSQKSFAYYTYVAAKGYISHFSPVFLFFQGDQTGRHSQVDMGQIFLFEALLIVIALFTIKLTQANKLILAWLLLAPIPAAIVTPTPHAYRTLQMSIPLAYFSGIGAYYFLSKKNFLLPKILLLVFALYWLILYLHLLFVHYPLKFAADWQDGYRQMVEKIKKHQDSFEKVYVTNINQVPYIYLLFYQKYDPTRFIQLGGDREGFDKYVFVSRDEDIYDKEVSKDTSLQSSPDNDQTAGLKGRILYVAPSWEKVDGKWLDAVDDSGGKHIYSLWEVGGSQ